MGLIGVLYSILAAIFFPRFLLEPEISSLPPAAALPVKILWKSITWPWGALSCALLIAQVVRLDAEKKKWAAFSLGLVLAYMAAQAIHS